MNKYTIINGKLSSIIRRNEDNAFIPINDDNSDYREYLNWINDGNEPDVVDYDL